MHVQDRRELRAVSSNGKMDEFHLVAFYRGDFRKSSETLQGEVEQMLGRKMKAGECGLVVSGTEKAVRLIFGAETFEISDRRGRPMEATRTMEAREHRILGGGTFHPLMIQNYAHKMGVHLKNRERLERFLKKEVREAGEEN